MLSLISCLLYSAGIFAASPNVECKLSESNPWLRQQMLVVCEFYTNRSFMEIAHEDIKLPWARTYKIPLHQHGVVRDGVQKYFHRFGWVIIPVRSGKGSIALPALKFDFGSYKVRVPKFAVEVKPLPVYLNPDSLVGKLKLTLKSASPFWLKHNNLYRFRFEVTAQGVPPQWLPDVGGWLQNKHHVRYYVQRVQTKVVIDHKGLVTKLIVDAAVEPASTGFYPLMQSSFRYFDPGKSKWINTPFQKQYWFSMPFWVYFVIFIIAFILAVRVGWKITRYLLGVTRLWLRQSKLKRDLLIAKDYDSLCRIRDLLLENYGINSKLPLYQVYGSWRIRYGVNIELYELTETMAEYDFSGGSEPKSDDLTVLRKTLLSLFSFTTVLACFHRK